MSECVYASITIGGSVSAAQFDELCTLIAAENLYDSTDDTPFRRDKCPAGEPLRLHHYSINYGVFEDLEQFCCTQHIPYIRWCGAQTGVFAAERIVFDGVTGPLNFTTDDEDHLVLDVQTITQLGSMRAIRAYLKPADFEVPPLIVRADAREPVAA